MIFTDELKFIPFRHLDRVQVAELLHKSVSAVDYYCRRGAKICEGYHVYLKKEKNGKFLTVEVIRFINLINKHNENSIRPITKS